jgi:hypothetical protein
VNIGPVRKAIAGAVVAGAGSFATAVTDNHLTLAEIGVVVLAAATAFGSVYGIANKAA